MKRLKSLAINAALVAGSLAIAAGVALALDGWLDLGLRFAIATLFERNVQEPEPIMYVYDNDTGWHLNPRTQYHRLRSGPFFSFANVQRFDTRLRVNGEGFIDRDHYQQTSRYRIAFAGNSWVEAVQQEYTDRFAPLTEDYVFDRSKQSKAVEIMNFGMSNAAPAQAFGIIRKYALKYHPDEIWLFVTAADIRANTPVDTPPPFGPTFEYADAGRTQLKDIRFGFVDPPAVAHWKRSRDLAGFDAASLNFARVMPYHYSSERDPVYDRVWGDMKLTMSLLKRTLDAQGIRLRAVYIPPRYEVDAKLWEQFRRAAGTALGKELPMEAARGEARFADLMRGLGIELISLTPLCREKGPAEMYSDHFSRMGHHWVADYLSHVIIDTVPDSPKTRP